MCDKCSLQKERRVLTSYHSTTTSYLSLELLNELHVNKGRCDFLHRVRYHEKNHRNKISFSQHQDTGSKRTKQGSWRQWHRGLATSTLTTQPTSTTSHYPYQNVGASWEVMSSSSNWIPIEFASREKTLKASLYFPKGREGWLTGYEAQRAYTHPYRFLNIDIYKNKRHI